MTFSAANTTLGAVIEQVDRITLVSDLTPVPWSVPEHVGVMEHERELLPVFDLEPESDAVAPAMIAVLKVRGHAVGLRIDNAGRVFSRWSRLDQELGPMPVPCAVAARAENEPFWLIDTDALWPHASAHEVTGRSIPEAATK